MADDMEHKVSSTTSLFSDEVHHYQAEPEPEAEPPQPERDLFSLDEIVDLVGGAQDALNRHMAEDDSPQEFTQVLDSHPEDLVTWAEPEPVPEEQPGLPDSTSPPLVSAPVLVPSPVAEEPKVIAPTAEPESTRIESEPRVEPAPEPSPENDALPAAAAPAEESERPTVTEEAPAAPASLVDLLYWRDVKTTGVVFGAALLLLLSLMACSIISVCSYIGLALLSVTICFRIYKGILQAIQKSDEGHPFKQYLDQEVALSEDMVHKYSDLALAKFNKGIGELRRLFLVDDLVDSIKFAVLMWILTYVGALFNGLTLLILGLIAVFSCPIIYEKHQVQIDHYVALVNNQLKDIVGKFQAAIPGMKRKTE